MKQIKKIKILLILIVTFVITGFFSQNLFLGKSPKINPFFITQIKKIFDSKTKTQPLSHNKIDEVIAKTVFKPVTKGVYAGEYQGVKVVRLVDSEVNWISYSFHLKDGRIVTIKVVEGSPPPTEAEIESFFSKKPH